MNHPSGYLIHFFENHTRTHTHTFKIGGGTGPKGFIFFCCNSHICMYPCIYLSPIFLTQIWEGHSWKKPAGDLTLKESVAVRCSVLQRIAMCCSVLSHIYTHPCIHLCFCLLVADMGGTCLKETCKGPHIKVEGCRVLECVAVWRIELQG